MEIEMNLISCAHCGMTFAITEDKMLRLKQSHETFYCPAGHPQSYPQMTEEERLRRRVKELEEAERNRQIAVLEEEQKRQRAAMKKKEKRTPPKQSGVKGKK
jgi:hypothetical protein